MPLLDPFTYAGIPGGNANPPAGGAAPPVPPLGSAPPGLQQSLPPGLLEALRARILGGQVPQPGGPGLPPQQQAMAAPPQPGGMPQGVLPGALGGAPMGNPEQMAAAAGAMPPPSYIRAMEMTKNLSPDAAPNPHDPGFVRAMKSLLAKGAISQEKYDAMINTPEQFGNK